MATINLYLDEVKKAHEILAKDVKILESKFAGKWHKIELDAKQVDGDKIKSASVGEEKILAQVVMNLGLSADAEKKLKTLGKFDGKVVKAGDYDFKITVNNTGHKARLEVVFPAAVQAFEPKEGEHYSFANNKVGSACKGDKKFMAKIKSIVEAGKKESGHGPVEYLGGALHAHVTNTEGIAWEWKGSKMHVVATGKKNNQNKQQQRGSSGKSLKTAQYDWDEG